MRIASITGAKNESDIIESFVRHNGRYIDDFYFVDDSVDKTPEILQLLSAEGFSINKVNLDTRDYQHSKVMTSVTRYINAAQKYDWIFYLDADEILYAPSKAHFIAILQSNATNEVGIIRHLEFASNGASFFDSPNPLKECFNIRSIQSQTRKIFVRGDQFDKVVIGPGQHDAFRPDGQALKYFESGMQLGHYPVRSAAQYVTRSIIIYASLVAKLNKIPGEGNHAVRQYEWLKQRGFEVTPEDVTSWGLKFGLDEATGPTCTLTAERPEFLAEINCRYQDLCRRNETLLLALELERVSNLLSEFRHKTHAAMSAMQGLF